MYREALELSTVYEELELPFLRAETEMRVALDASTRLFSGALVSLLASGSSSIQRLSFRFGFGQGIGSTRDFS